MSNGKLIVKGIAKWAHVQKPEVYEGKPIGYSIQVTPSEKDLANLKKILTAMWEENKEEVANGKKLNYKIEPNLGIKETDEGEEYIKASCKHFFKDKVTGEEIPKVLPLFDKHGTPLPAGTLIGNGSLVEVAFLPRPYAVNSKVFGIKLLLQGVLVRELVEYGGSSAADFGFTVEEVDEDEEEVDF